MSKLFKHILVTFFFVGMFSQSQAAENIATEETPRLEQNRVREDQSYVQPKTYENDFKERYDSSEYNYNNNETEEGWFSRFIDWIEELIQDWFDFGTRKEASDFVEKAVNIFYIIVIILVVFFIVRAMMNGEGRWVFGRRSDRRIVRYEDIDTDIHETDFNQLLRDAEAEKDFRMAIRFQYLNMLKQLSATEIIAFDPEKTNLDYTYEIKDESVREQFQYTSYLYNYVWYGDFEINEAQYEKARESFTILLKNVAA